MILGFVAVVLIAGMILFVSSTQSLAIVDSNGNTPSAIGNATDGLVTNVTSVGGTATGYLVLIIAAVVIIAGVGMVYLYGKRF